MTDSWLWRWKDLPVRTFDIAVLGIALVGVCLMSYAHGTVGGFLMVGVIVGTLATEPS